MFMVFLILWISASLKCKLLNLFVMQQLTDTISDEESFENDGDGYWPFQSYVEQLLIDMFDPGE